jgi:hypothetical protein
MLFNELLVLDQHHLEIAKSLLFGSPEFHGLDKGRTGCVEHRDYAGRQDTPPPFIVLPLQGAFRVVLG